MDLTKWIRSRAATGQPLNLHSVARERPDLLELAFSGPTPRGWRGSLLDAGVDPYKIVHDYENQVECRVCGASLAVLGTHLKTRHDMTGDEYRQEFGEDCEMSSETCRAAHFGGRSIAGISHWERLWSGHYAIDWILRLHEEGHNLNYRHIVKIGHPLSSTSLRIFGSWDAALQAAGLDPKLLRNRPVDRTWTQSKVVEGLHNFAKLKQENPGREMSVPLQNSVRRFFGSLEAACRAVGLDYEVVNPRALIKGEPVARLVAAIRSLEGLKGSDRRRRLDDICRNKGNLRIIRGHFSSLQLLAAENGIDPFVVSWKTYRDEADVQHDLDGLERGGMRLSYTALKDDHKGLYNVIRKTGWGAERLNDMPRLPRQYPPCNPRSGLLHDRMIILRRRLRISAATAANKAGICMETWTDTEKGLRKPKPATVEKIERLLEEHRIPVSTAPHEPVQ